MNAVRTSFVLARTSIRRAAIPLSLAVVTAGFVAVFFGWLEASGTADVRIQMQDLISGGIGGVALIVVGATLAYATVADRSAARSEQLLGRVADRLEASAPQPKASADDRLIATHASVHREGCDLISGVTEAATVSARDARRRGLSICRVCRPEVLA